MTTGPEHFQQADTSVEEAFGGDDADNPQEKIAGLLSALISTQQALIAVGVMHAEMFATATGQEHPDLAAWREVIPTAALKEGDTP